jgi:hypothetical protein
VATHSSNETTPQIQEPFATVVVFPPEEEEAAAAGDDAIVVSFDLP